MTLFSFFAMERSRCIIFDMDGTLTATNQLIFDSFNQVAARYLGRTLTPTEVIAYFGPPEEGAVRRMIGTDDITEAMQGYYAYYRSEHQRLAVLYPGIRELLQSLHDRGVTIALFTGKGRRTTDITMEEFGIAHFFAMTVTGDDVESYKPSGDGIRRILARFNLRPEDAVMIGDSTSDILAARECGVTMASVVWDSYGKEEVIAMKPDHLFHDVQRLSQWLTSVVSDSGSIADGSKGVR